MTKYLFDHYQSFVQYLKEDICIFQYEIELKYLVIHVSCCLHKVSPLILTSNMMSFVGYMSNARLKLQIYFTSHMRFAGQIMDMIPGWILVIV